MMFDRPRNWKWMVPAALIAPCIVWWNALVEWGGAWAVWAVIPAVLIVILGIATAINLFLYVQHYARDIYAGFLAAQNMTPEVRMFEAAKGMHPEAVKALLLHRRTIWRVKYVTTKELVTWILDEAPSVQVGFVDYVLDHSSAASLMPKRLLSEGSKQFDPEELVTDREQYDDLVLLLQQKLMVTRAYGNQAPQFIPPWTPELLRHRFGLEEVSSFTSQVSGDEETQAVVKANGKRVEETNLTPNPSPKGEGSKAEREMTDEEWEAVTKENEAFAQRYRP